MNIPLELTPLAIILNPNVSLWSGGDRIAVVGYDEPVTTAHPLGGIGQSRAGYASSMTLSSISSTASSWRISWRASGPISVSRPTTPLEICPGSSKRGPAGEDGHEHVAACQRRTSQRMDATGGLDKELLVHPTLHPLHTFLCATGMTRIESTISLHRTRSESNLH